MIIKEVLEAWGYRIEDMPNGITFKAHYTGGADPEVMMALDMGLLQVERYLIRGGCIQIRTTESSRPGQHSPPG